MGEQRCGGLGGGGEISAAAPRASMGLSCGGEAAAAPQAAARRRDARVGPRPPSTTAGSVPVPTASTARSTSGCHRRRLLCLPRHGGRQVGEEHRAWGFYQGRRGFFGEDCANCCRQTIPSVRTGSSPPSTSRSSSYSARAARRFILDHAPKPATNETTMPLSLLSKCRPRGGFSQKICVRRRGCLSVVRALISFLTI